MSRRDNPYSKPDSRTLEARARGFPARSVFKLEEIDKRVGLLAPGQRVLDLGAAPGSWSLYASRRVGPGGRVLAIDLNPIEQAFPANVTVLQADALALDTELLAQQGPFDVVLSDMAPATSGNKVRDQALSYELFERALQVALAHGREGSSFVAKLFMSGDFPAARESLRRSYETERTIRPRGTRQESSEVFLVGLNKRGGCE